MRHRVGLEGLDAAGKGHEEDIASFVTTTIREAGGQLRDGAREETRSALGSRLEKAWRAKFYPDHGNSIDASAFVWTRAPKIIHAFDQGVTIRSANGTWLAIPTEAAGRWGIREGRSGFGVTVNSRGARARVTPGGFERRTGMKLRFVYQPGKPSLLVVDRAQLNRHGGRGIAVPYRGKGRGSKLYGPEGRTIVIFILVRQVRLNKRMNLEAIAAEVSAAYPNLLSKNWR